MFAKEPHVTPLRLFAMLTAIGSAIGHGGPRSLEDGACHPPDLPERFPQRTDSFLPTSALGFTLEQAPGRYELIVAVGNKVTPTAAIMELARLSPADSGWALDVRKSLGRAPTLLGASDELRDIRLPSIADYVIMGDDKRLGVQADITSGGALVFALGDHLYGGTATVFQTTRRDGSTSWRGWWWYPLQQSPDGHGYFCLRKV